MKTRDVDVAVIGAGSAGLVAFRNAKAFTDSVVLIEGGAYGTTCARVGCMPSKLLIAAADIADNLSKASEVGLELREVKVNGSAVMDRVRRERDRFVGFVVDGVESIPAEQRIRGYATFIDDHRLQVDEHTIVNAKRIVIATGSSPNVPAFLSPLGDRVLVNDDVFDWQDLPESVAVFGPGVIGLELGNALSRLGVKVTIFGRGGGLGPLTDPKVLDVARRSFERQFVLDADAAVESVERVDDVVRITYRGADGGVVSTNVDYVIAATGREPNLSRLGLENTSLPLDERGVPRFDPFTSRIGESHVFIAGDVNNDRSLLHEAADEGRIAGINSGRYPDVRPELRRSPLGIVFSEPQMALVGDRYADLDAASAVIGSVSFEDQGRSRVMLQNEGLLRIYADRQSGRFLGAEMLGPRAEHLGHLLAWAHQSGMTVADMLDMPFYHPVVEEGLRTALRDVQRKLGERALKAA